MNQENEYRGVKEIKSGIYPGIPGFYLIFVINEFYRKKFKYHFHFICSEGKFLKWDSDSISYWRNTNKVAPDILNSIVNFSPQIFFLKDKYFLLERYIE